MGRAYGYGWDREYYGDCYDCGAELWGRARKRCPPCYKIHCRAQDRAAAKAAKLAIKVAETAKKAHQHQINADAKIAAAAEKAEAKLVAAAEKLAVKAEKLAAKAAKDTEKAEKLSAKEDARAVKAAKKTAPVNKVAPKAKK